jgi:hypothetical protein
MRPRTPRQIALWVFTVGLAGFALLVPDRSTDVVPPAADAAGAAERLKIVALSHAELHPGDALVVRVSGLDPDRPVAATVDKQDARVVRGRDDVVIVLVPGDADAGKAALRITQGVRKAKPRDLIIQAVHPGSAARGLIGGLALALFGLLTLAGGLSRGAGRDDRALVATATRGPVRGVGLGVALGAVTQLTTSAAGIAVGLVEARLVGIAAAVTLLIGAQVGSLVVGTFLPSAIGAEGLTIVAIGVAWLLLAPHSRIDAIGRALIGIGLLVHGVHTAQVALAPMLGDAQLLARLVELQGEGVGSVLGCFGLGAVGGLLGQGPGPVMALSVGIARETGGIETIGLVALLAGASLGGAIGAAIVVLPIRDGRRLAAATLALWTAGALLLLATVPVWSAAAAAISSHWPDLDEGFILGLVMGAAYALVGALLTAVAAVVRRTLEGASQVTPPVAHDDAIREQLVLVLRDQKRAMQAIASLVASGEREHGVAAEQALARARRTVERAHALARAGGVSGPILGAAIATLQAQRAAEELRWLAEQGVEGNVVLAGDDAAAVLAHQALVVEGLDGLVDAIASGVPPDLEAAQVREIRLNAEEARRRKQTASSRGSGVHRLFQPSAIELFDAYENLGNKLYRIYEALAAGPLDELG